MLTMHEVKFKAFDFFWFFYVGLAGIVYALPQTRNIDNNVLFHVVHLP